MIPLSGLRLTVMSVFGLLAMSTADAAQITISSWVPQFVGIDAAQAMFSNSVAYIDRVDTQASGIGFTTTPHSGALATTAQTTSQFLQSSGTQVAINANFFAPCCDVAAEPKSLIGLAILNGVVVSPMATGNDDAAASLLISAADKAAIKPSNLSGGVDAANAFNAVSGNIIVTDGVDTSSVTPTGAPHDPFGLDPRTGVGLSADGRYLYLIAIDGRQKGYSIGVTTSDEAQLMLALGIYQGLNLDGGGSTTLVQDNGLGGYNIINRPSGGTERYDGNSFGVYAARLSPVPLPPAVGLFGGALVILGIARFARFRSRASAV